MYILCYRDQKGISASDRLRYYRMLQLLSSRYSKAYGSLFIPSIMVFIVNNIILSIYGIIKLHDQLEFDKLINFPIMISINILGLFLFIPKLSTLYESTRTEALNSLRISLVNVGSRNMESFKMRLKKVQENDSEIQAETSHNFRVESHGWKRTQSVSRSCPALGVPFGSLYVIKRSTVLTLFDFTACNAVSALIAYP